MTENEAMREAAEALDEKKQPILVLSEVVDQMLKELYGEKRVFVLAFEAEKTDKTSSMVVAGNGFHSDTADTLRDMADVLDEHASKH